MAENAVWRTIMIAVAMRFNRHGHRVYKSILQIICKWRCNDASRLLYGSAGDNYLYGGTDIVNLRVGTTSSYRYFNFADRNGGSSIGTASGALSLGIGADDYLTIDTSG